MPTMLLAVWVWMLMLALLGVLVGVCMAMGAMYTFLAGWNWWLFAGSSVAIPFVSFFVLQPLTSVPVYGESGPYRSRRSRYFGWIMGALAVPVGVAHMAASLRAVGWYELAEMLYGRRVGYGLWVLLAVITLPLVKAAWQVFVDRARYPVWLGYHLARNKF